MIDACAGFMLARFNLFLIMLIGFIDQMGLGLVYPLFAVLLFDPTANILALETSEWWRGFLLGILIGLTPLSQFFSAPLLGALSDRIGRRKVLQWGVFMGVVGYILAIIGLCVGSIALLFLYRLIVGISDGTAAVAQAALADISTEENKARHFSLLNMAFGAGFTMGPFLGGKLSDPTFFSWCTYSTPFYFAGCMSLLNFLLIMWKFPETRAVNANAAPFKFLEGVYNLRRAFTMQGLRVFFVAAFLFSFGWSFYTEFSPVLLRAQFGFTASHVGNYYAYMGLWYSLSAGLLTAPLLNRYPPDQIVAKALITAGLYMPLFLLIDEPIQLWLYLPVLLFLLALIYPTSGAIVSNRSDPDKQGEVLGIYNSVGAFAIGISPLFAGSLVAEYPSLTVWIGGFCLFSAGGLYWLENRKSVKAGELALESK